MPIAALLLALHLHAPMHPSAAVSGSNDATVRARNAGVQGTVFIDANGNGRMDAGERGLAGVAVSDQVNVVVTDNSGRYMLPNGGSATGVVFVSVPDGYRSSDSFFHTVADANGAAIDFALRAQPRAASFTFMHASDTHISDASVARTARLRALVDSIKPSFVIITGDLVKDALRVGEAEATGYYDLFQAEAAKFTRPLWTVPGNHENFGIERDKSKVDASHPLYGRAMYRKYRGPDYYSFNQGGVHFVALNTVDIDDTRYYGHVDSLQLEWFARDLAQLAPTTPVVTFNHIPFYSAMEVFNGYTDAPPAPSLITVNGKTNFRHTVSNAREVLARLKGHPYPLALAGHVHVRETIRITGVATRFDQVSAVVGPSSGPTGELPSGITVYRVTSQGVSEGVFVPFGLDQPAPRR